MAKAYKCDICGELYENRIAINLNKDNKAYLKMCDHIYDICPNCVNAIQEVINQHMKYKN